MKRQYLKCLECKKPFAIQTDKTIIETGWMRRQYRWKEEYLQEHRLPNNILIDDVQCPNCEAKGAFKIKYMGEVIKRTVNMQFYTSPCDGRCTNAPGNNCDCSCGGENHGTKRLISVEKVVCVDVAKVTVTL